MYMPSLFVVVACSSSLGPPLTVTITPGSGASSSPTVTVPSIAAVRSMMPSNGTVPVSWSSTVTVAEVPSGNPYSSSSNPEIATE